VVLLRLVQQLLAVMMILPECRWDVMWHYRSRREVIRVMVVGRRSTSGWSAYAIRPIFLPECRCDIMWHYRSRHEMIRVMVVGRRSTSGWSAYAIRPYWTACSPWEVHHLLLLLLQMWSRLMLDVIGHLLPMGSNSTSQDCPKPGEVGSRWSRWESIEHIPMSCCWTMQRIKIILYLRYCNSCCLMCSIPNDP
jgi:hypothetical protein